VAESQHAHVRLRFCMKREANGGWRNKHKQQKRAGGGDYYPVSRVWLQKMARIDHRALDYFIVVVVVLAVALPRLRDREQTYKIAAFDDGWLTETPDAEQMDSPYLVRSKRIQTICINI
jgi:hypothetical protein